MVLNFGLKVLNLIKDDSDVRTKFAKDVFGRDMGQQPCLKAAVGDVSDAGGDGGGQAGADDGTKRYFCAGLLEYRCQPDAKSPQAASSDSDVYADDCDVRNHRGFVPQGVYAGYERGAGPYIPLIIVNCIIIGRAEACASKNGVLVSIVDALGMGAGFTLALCLLATIRELLATGKLFEMPVMPSWFMPWAGMGMPVGAFVTLGLLLAGVNLLTRKTQ